MELNLEISTNGRCTMSCNHCSHGSTGNKDRQFTHKIKETLKTLYNFGSYEYAGVGVMNSDVSLEELSNILVGRVDSLALALGSHNDFLAIGNPDIVRKFQEINTRFISITGDRLGRSIDLGYTFTGIQDADVNPIVNKILDLSRGVLESELSKEIRPVLNFSLNSGTLLQQGLITQLNDRVRDGYRRIINGNQYFHSEMTCSTEVHRGVTYIIDQSHEFWVVVRGIVPSFSKQKVKKYLIQSLKEIEKEDKPLTITLFPDEVRLLHSTRNINDPLLSLSHEEFRNIISFCTDKGVPIANFLVEFIRSRLNEKQKTIPLILKP